jgi:hypothetical protein
MLFLVAGALAAGGLLPLQSALAYPPPPLPRWEPPEGLWSEGVIRGTVRAADGKPEGATLRVRQYTRGSVEREAACNAQGEFEIRSLPPGRYWLSIRRQLVGDVEITADRPEVAVRLTAPPPLARLRGVVRVKATGQPVRGALVVTGLTSQANAFIPYRTNATCYELAQHSLAELVQWAGQEGVPFTLTDSQGRYELRPGEAAGEVFAIAPDRALFPQRWQWTSSLPGETTHDFALEPTRDFLLRGCITRPDGKPWAGGQAKLWVRQHPDVSYPIRTDDRGRYELLPAMVYGTVWLTAPSFAPMHLHAPLGQDTPAPRLDWQLRPPQTGTVSARVLRRDGITPVPDGFEVHYIAADSMREREKVGPDGAPRIFYYMDCDEGGRGSRSLKVRDGVARAEIEPGTYTLYAVPLARTGKQAAPGADPNWYGPWETGVFARQGNRFAAWETRFTVEPKGRAAVVFREPDLPALTVSVARPDGTPVKGVRVAAVRWDERTQSYAGYLSGPVTDGKGQVLFDPMVPGTYLVDAHRTLNHPGQLWRHAVTLEAGKHRQLRVTLLPEDDKAAQRERHTFRLAGRVLLPDGKTPARIAAVYAVPEGQEIGGGEPTGFADGLGYFTFTGERPGVLTLHVLGPVTVYARGDGTALTGIPARTDQGEAAPVRIVLHRGLTLRGRVRPEGGAPLADLTVAALPYPWSTPSRTMAGQLLATPVSQDGTFTLCGLGPGKQYVCLYRAGQLQPASVRALDLRQGQAPPEVTLPLQRESGGLEVHFRRADGKPVPPSLSAYLFNAYDRVSRAVLSPGSSGVYVSGKLSAGTYQVWVDAASYHVERGLGMPPGHVERGIEVKPGDRPRRVEIVLPAGGGIRGSVLRADGTGPARGCRVGVHVDGPGRADRAYLPAPWLRARERVPSYAETKTAPDGTFRLFGLTPGRYAVAVWFTDEGGPTVVSGVVEVRAGELADVGALRPTGTGGGK